mgnify:CR=1 FL=1
MLVSLLNIVLITAIAQIVVLKTRFQLTEEEAMHLKMTFKMR